MGSSTRRINNNKKKSRRLAQKRVPASVEKKNIWFANLGIDAGSPMPKVPMICSTHFEKNDFCYKTDLKKHLKSDAIPKGAEIAFASSLPKDDSAVAPLKQFSEKCISGPSEFDANVTISTTRTKAVMEEPAAPLKREPDIVNHDLSESFSADQLAAAVKIEIDEEDFASRLSSIKAEVDAEELTDQCGPRSIRAFFDGVAETVSRLPPPLVDKVKMGVLQLISEVELERDQSVMSTTMHSLSTT